MKIALATLDKKDWVTPQKLFDKVNAQFYFDCDVAADDNNYKCKKYFTKETDALKQDWKGVCWCNPPYGRGLDAWVKKAYESSCNSLNVVVMLLPARTDTKWFHDYIYGKAQIIFLKGRLKFSGSKNSAPFPSMIVVFDEGKREAKAVDKE